MNVKNIDISSTLLYLCPLNLSFKLNFNISKVTLHLNKVHRHHHHVWQTKSLKSRNLDVTCPNFQI